jgi:hypothetical protein
MRLPNELVCFGENPGPGRKLETDISLQSLQSLRAEIESAANGLAVIFRLDDE